MVFPSFVTFCLLSVCACVPWPTGGGQRTRRELTCARSLVYHCVLRIELRSSGLAVRASTHTVSFLTLLLFIIQFLFTFILVWLLMNIHSFICSLTCFPQFIYLFIYWLFHSFIHFMHSSFCEYLWYARFSLKAGFTRINHTPPSL